MRGTAPARENQNHYYFDHRVLRLYDTDLLYLSSSRGRCAISSLGGCGYSWQHAGYGSALSVAGFNMAAPADFLNFIDINKDRFIQRLASAIEIPRYYPPDRLA